MGATTCKGTPNSNKAITIAILGLDNAGKTTTTRVLEKVMLVFCLRDIMGIVLIHFEIAAPVDSVAPTIGYSQSEITHKNEKIKLIDLGGAKTFREAWRHYYDDAYGFVYVLDSSEEDRLGENRDVLKRLLQEEKVKGKPILILANKQDKAEALDKNTILEDLKIERLVNENQTLCRVELCTAKSMSRSGKHSKIDESIRHGFDWLIKTVYEHFDTLNKRVENDVRKRTEAEEQAKRERKERVQKLREEREKEEGAENNNDDDETMKNGFVPIGQAVKNAERNTSEKPSKNKSNYDKSKSEPTSESTSLPPIPAPRSTSRNRTLDNEEDSDDQERPSRENSLRRNQSPVPRSVSSNFDENEAMNRIDDSSLMPVRSGKKKKVIGAGRHRLPGDNLPPPAPSSSASRREDFPQSKRPLVGTPRPQGIVAQWAITSPAPHSTADKLITINSDNELDNDEEGYKSFQAGKRIASPHPRTTNRIIHEKKNHNTEDDKPSIRKSPSQLSDEEENFEDQRKKTNSTERDRPSRQRYDENLPSRRIPSSTGDSSRRSHSRTNGKIDDDDDLR